MVEDVDSILYVHREFVGDFLGYLEPELLILFKAIDNCLVMALLLIYFL